MSGICSEHQGFDKDCPRCNAIKYTQKQIDAQKIKADKAYEKFTKALEKACLLQTICEREDEDYRCMQWNRDDLFVQTGETVKYLNAKKLRDKLNKENIK